MNAMLLNEFLKQHRKVEQQERKIQEQDYKVREQAATISAMQSTVTQQQKGMEVLTAQLRQQAAQIQRVSAQLEVSKRARKWLTTISKAAALALTADSNLNNPTNNKRNGNKQ